jgi:UDP-N-acetylmuramate: L-alanyl-gamma-D-glutamyl-meso-diaminopimelate ligase
MKAEGKVSGPDFRPGQSIHMVAVGGVGMSALAGLLQARGFHVTGSDEAIYPPASTLLERLGIEVRRGYRPEHLHGADAVIIGNAVTRTNPEAAAALERGLPVHSMPEVLGSLFLAQRRTLVVAGTHGKTTTTAMLAWVLERAGRSPGFLVGGVPLDLGMSFAVGNGEDFVIEGDEYDSAFFDKRPKFIHYRPRAVLLNAIEFDHADIYQDLAHVKRAFAELVRLLPREAPLVVASEFPHAVEVARAARGDAIFFGNAPGSAWRAVDVHDDGERTAFAIETDGRQVATVRLRLLGDMNVRNALGVFVLCRALGIAADEIVPGLESFKGVRRRQEHVGERRGVVVLDDFAHHPTAVAGTLAAVRSRYRTRRVIAVFEPRSNTSRRRVFQEAFADALAHAPVVILSAVYEKPNDPLPAAERLSTDELVANLCGRGIAATVLPSPEAIAQHLATTAQVGDVIVVMSNGAFGGLPRRLLEVLEPSGVPGGVSSASGTSASGASSVSGN